MAGRPFGLGNRVQFGAGSLNQTATVQWRLDELPGQGLNDGLRCRVGLDRAYTPRILLVYYTLPPWCKPVRTSHVAPVMVRPCASVSYLLASLADAGMCRYYMIRSSNVALIHSCCMEPSYNILHRSACWKHGWVVWHHLATICPSSKRSERYRRSKFNTTNTWQQGLCVLFFWCSGRGEVVSLAERVTGILS